MFSGVTFFTEGGHSIGLGHVVRSVALARALSKCGVPINFVINDDSSVKALLECYGFKYALSSIDNFKTTLEFGSVVVVDTKKDFTSLALFLKKSGRSIVAIDNHKLNGLCDTVIIPSATFDPVRWIKDKREAPAKGVNSLFGGSDYVVVADTFLEHRSEKRVVAQTPLKVLISMGGSDPNGLSELLLNALSGVSGIEVCTVVGPAVEVTDTLQAVIDSPPENLTFLFRVKNLAPVAVSADIVFTALGITVYELASIGVPSVLIGNYADDVEEMSKLEAMGICTSLGFYKDVTDEAVKKRVRFFLDERVELSAISVKAKAVIDGRGAQRIANILGALFKESTIEENGTVHA